MGSRPVEPEQRKKNRKKGRGKTTSAVVNEPLPTGGVPSSGGSGTETEQPPKQLPDVAGIKPLSGGGYASAVSGGVLPAAAVSSTTSWAEKFSAGRHPEQLYSSADEMQPLEVKPRKKKTKARGGGVEPAEEKKVKRSEDNCFLVFCPMLTQVKPTIKQCCGAGAGLEVRLQLQLRRKRKKI